MNISKFKWRTIPNLLAKTFVIFHRHECYMFSKSFFVSYSENLFWIFSRFYHVIHYDYDVDVHLVPAGCSSWSMSWDPAPVSPVWSWSVDTYYKYMKTCKICLLYLKNFLFTTGDPTLNRLLICEFSKIGKNKIYNFERFKIYT